MRIFINSVEQKQEKKRIFFSIFLSVFFHLMLILVLFIFRNVDEKKEIVVMNVRLPEKVIEEINRMEEGQKEQYINKQKKQMEKIRKELLKKKNIYEKKSEIDDKNSKDNKISDMTEKNNNIKIDEKSDLIEKFNKQQSDQKQKVEEDFFKSKSEQDQSNIDNIDQALNKLNDLDNILQGIEEGKDDFNNQIKSDGEDDKNILWEKGSSKRKIVTSIPIIIPDEIQKEGLKLQLALKFTVMPSGIIIKAEVLETSGNSELDQIIIEQFKKWKFEAVGENYENAIGTIKISIGY